MIKTFKPQNILQTLGIDNPPKHKPINYQYPFKNQYVHTEKGVELASDAISRYTNQFIGARIGDSVIAESQFGGGNININQINSIALDNVFLGWGELSLLQQNCIVNNLMDIISSHMTEKWITVRSKDESKADKIRELEQAITDYELKPLMTLLIKKAYLLGTCYISPKLEGDEDGEAAEPLLLDSAKVKNGSLERFYVIEPTWIVPIDFNMTKPRSHNFFKPQSFITFGERVHHSRMKRFMFIEPMNLVSPIYLFGGIPPTQQILPYILDFINTKKEIVKIVSRFNLSVLQTNLNLLKGVDQYGKATTDSGSAYGRARAFNAMRNNEGLLMLSKDEVFTQLQINTAGLAEILQQQGEFLSLFTRIPISTLFGQAPRGMNATGEFDANNFNQLIHTLQESKLRPILQYCIDIIQLSRFGGIDPDIEFDFVPIGELNLTTQSQLLNDKVNRATTLVSNGLADPLKMMEILQKDPDLNLDDYEVDFNVEDPEVEE